MYVFINALTVNNLIISKQIRLYTFLIEGMNTDFTDQMITFARFQKIAVCAGTGISQKFAI